MHRRAKGVKEEKDAPIPKLAKFLSGYSNASTRSGYKNAIEPFLRSVYRVPEKPKPDYDALFEMYLIEAKRDHDADFRKYADHLLKVEGRPAGSAKQVMTFCRYVLNYHGINISKGTSQDIRRETKGDRATVKRTITREIIADALLHCDVKARALILCLASSGSRLNEMLCVKLADCDFDARPSKIVIRQECTKTRKQRYTYISEEATSAVKEWLKVRDEYIAMSNAKSKKLIERGRATLKSTDDPRLFPFSDAAANNWWSDALKATGKYSKDSVTGRNQMSGHGFRAFFISQMGLVISKDIPEFLAGHAGYLTGAYRQFTEETTAAEYLKAQHMVCIGGTKQIKELETELNQTKIEQTNKNEKFSDALISVIQENTNLKKENVEMKQKMVEMESKLSAVDAAQKQYEINTEILFERLREEITRKQQVEIEKILKKIGKKQFAEPITLDDVLGS